jgi:spore coat protein U-like protein
MKRLIASILAAPVVLAAGGAWAACASFTADPINVTYNPLGATGALGVVRPVSAMVSRVDGGSLNEVVGQFMDQGQSAGSVFILNGGPTYDIVNAFGQLVVVHPSSTPLGPGHVFFPSTLGFNDHGHPPTTAPVNALGFYLPPGQDVAAGVYSETLDVQYGCGDGRGGAGPANLQTGVLPITVIVPSTLSVNLAGGIAHGAIDFGAFASLTKSANVQVRSTGPFSLVITAEHNGKMYLFGTSGGAGQEIPYALSFNGNAVTLGDSTSYTRTGVGGLSMPLSVTAQDIGANRAGFYKDTLTLVFTPKATL